MTIYKFPIVVLITSVVMACSYEVDPHSNTVIDDSNDLDNEYSYTSTPFVPTDDFISSTNDGTNPDVIEGSLYVEASETDRSSIHERSVEHSRLTERFSAMLADDDPSNDDFAQFRLSFRSNADYMRFVKNASDSEIEQYSRDNGLKNIVPRKKTQDQDQAQARESLKWGEGRYDSCYAKFVFKDRNKGHSPWKTFFGIPYAPLPVVYYVNGNGVTSVATRFDIGGNIRGTRDSECQSDVGKAGVSGDEGGHIIADSLGGFGKKINLTPQNRDVNQRIFKSIENAVKVCADLGVGIDYFYIMQYPNATSIRPLSYELFFNALHANWERQVYAFIPNKNPTLENIVDINDEADNIRAFCRRV